MNTELPINDSKPQTPVLRPWLRVLLFLIVNFALMAFLVGLVFLEMSTVEAQSELDELYIIQIVSLFATCISVWFFRIFLDKKSFFSLGFAWEKWGQDFAVGFGLGFAVIAVGTVILIFLGQLEITEIIFDPAMLFSYFILCIIIALNEEILVRGYVLNNLMESMHKYWALVASAAVFTFFHALNPNINFLAVINLMLAGILLGIYYIHQQNLWFPIALHTSWNYSEGAIFGYEVSGIEFESLLQQNIGNVDWLTGGYFGFEGSALLSVLLVAAIWGVHWWYSPEGSAK